MIEFSQDQLIWSEARVQGWGPDALVTLARAPDRGHCAGIGQSSSAAALRPQSPLVGAPLRGLAPQVVVTFEE